MKLIYSTVTTIIVVAALTPVLQAQWPSVTTADVPKAADGKPNLEGPAPRTIDGKPDLSGLWEGPPFVSQRSGAPQPPEPSISEGNGNAPPEGDFYTIGRRLKEGMPYTPWAAEVRRNRELNHAKDNPQANCLPLGLTQFHMTATPRKIIQSPKLIVILYEEGGYRQIFMDGRSLPTNDPLPWFFGYSIGRWEGDTLVVETTGFRDDGWLDINGSPLTSSGRLTERIRRPNYGSLEIDVTVEDPKSYTKPFTVRIKNHLMLNTEMIEYVCNENERSSQHYVPEKN